jgi:hypothetical protein
LEERHNGIVEVVGSIPIVSTTVREFPLALWSEKIPTQTAPLAVIADNFLFIVLS